MMRIIVWLLVAAIAFSSPARAEADWTTAQAENLLHWIERGPDEALTLPSDTAPRLRSAIDAGDLAELQPVANEAAITLMRAWRGQCCGERRPAWWHIDGRGSDAELRAGLEAALQAKTLDLYLRTVRPSHPHYQRLLEAWSQETDPARRQVLALNLARWRWLPTQLGDRYLLVNIASQQLTMWQGGVVTGRWRIIVGKPATRTPVFTTQVTGVVLNPWWEIPSSIAAEGIGSFVRRSPAAARARGYVYQNGRYRQMPGDNNALGRMKLVMPNPYSVFLHDTSNRELFSKDRRFFSHGCMRVDRALSFAAVLLARNGWDLEKVEEEVATDKTQTIPLAAPLPLYVTYFTAEPSLSGGVRFLEDVYRRDPIRLSALERGHAKVLYGSHLAAQTETVDELGGAIGCQI